MKNEHMKKLEVIQLAATDLLHGNVSEAKTVIEAEYPFHKLKAQRRNYTDKEKPEQKELF